MEMMMKVSNSKPLSHYYLKNNNNLILISSRRRSRSKAMMMTTMPITMMIKKKKKKNYEERLNIWKLSYHHPHTFTNNSNARCGCLKMTIICFKPNINNSPIR